MSKHRKEKLELPIKITMSEEGESYFIHHGRHLSRITFADGTEKRGIILKNFSPKQLQTLLLDGYVSRIEVSRAHYEPVREDIMDLSRAIVYVFLYKKFNQELFFEIIQSDCVRIHNRLNPGMLFDSQTQISKKHIKKENSANKSNIVKLSKAILAPIWKVIKTNKKYDKDEEKLYSLMANKFISQINSYSWFIITSLSGEKDFPQILAIIQKTVLKYLEKSKIAEYIALMVIELAQNNENTNIRRVLRQKYPNKKDINPLVFNPKIRKQIVNELEANGEFSHVLYKIGGGVYAIGKQGRFQITILSQTDKYLEIKDSIESKRNLELAQRSLDDFYHTLPSEEKEGNLGFYYLSYLNEECRNADIKFNSFVNQFTGSNLTVINLVFNI